MKYYLVVGEASGDLHASNLMKELLKKDPEADFRFFGGDLMQAVGGKLSKHYKDMSFMGFAEVIANLPTILGNLKECKKDIQAYRPDCVIFVDFPGFNLRLAPFVNSLGIKTIYYISPQLWAWKEGRIKTIKKYIDKMLVILPFEQQWYADREYQVEFVGHPLLDAIEDFEFETKENFYQNNQLSDKPIIALLPGSRKQEIDKKLPLMVKASQGFPDYQFIIAGAPAQEEKVYRDYLGEEIRVVFQQTYSLLYHAEAALVTSGTATLETALLSCPEVVCYKGSWLSYQIGKRLVKGIEYISLVNLIMQRELVTELIQNELTIDNIHRELGSILSGKKRTEILLGYQELKEKLGGKGASERAAQEILSAF